MQKQKLVHKITFETSDGRKEVNIVHKELYDQTYELVHKGDFCEECGETKQTEKVRFVNDNGFFLLDLCKQCKERNEYGL